MLRMRVIPGFSAVLLFFWLAGASLPCAAELRIVSSTGHAPLLGRLFEAFARERPEVSGGVSDGPRHFSREADLEFRLSTGAMGDLFSFPSGALFNAIDAENSLVDLSWLPLLRRVKGEFVSNVRRNGRVYGIPLGGPSVGGIFYSYDVYAELGLSPPESWEQFMENNRKIAEAGLIPVMQTYRSSWTAQMLFLADYFNVHREEPQFAADLSANRTSFSGSAAALRSFAKVEELVSAGYMNADRELLVIEDGLIALAEGRAAHYPILDFGLDLLERMRPGASERIGFFPIPPDVPGKTGVTLWMPPALYVSKSSNNIDGSLDFLDFIASPAGCALTTSANRRALSYIADCATGAGLPPSLRGLMTYLDDPARHVAALEFLSPLKGPSLEQICTALGLGIIDAPEAARRYDRDIKRRARELGLEAWR
ncbi:MAG: extracellular solute-binding protein [Geminicoccaceae bacterium]